MLELALEARPEGTETERLVIWVTRLCPGFDRERPRCSPGAPSWPLCVPGSENSKRKSESVKDARSKAPRKSALPCWRAAMASADSTRRTADTSPRFTSSRTWTRPRSRGNSSTSARRIPGRRTVRTWARTASARSGVGRGRSAGFGWATPSVGRAAAGSNRPELDRAEFGSAAGPDSDLAAVCWSL